MTKRKPKEPDVALTLALDAIGLEIERIHDQVEDGATLDRNDREALTDYTKTLLSAQNTRSKRITDEEKDDANPTPEDIEAAIAILRATNE